MTVLRTGCLDPDVLQLLDSEDVVHFPRLTMVMVIALSRVNYL